MRSYRFLASMVAVSALVLVACGKDNTPDDDPDGGDTNQPKSCQTHGECGDGFYCQGGLCTENKCTQNSECPTGWECDPLEGKCKFDEAQQPDGGTDGGEPTDGGDPNDGGTPIGGHCQTKYDCAAGQICKSGRCANPQASNACNSDIDCAAGKICNFSKQCEDGCIDPRDCAVPKLCHPTKFVCETCSLTNPCPAGKSCVGGECKDAVACTNAQDCVDKGLDGAVCLGGACSNCGGHGDCRVPPYVNTSNPNQSRVCATDGLCKKVNCNDNDCQAALGPRGYCNTTENKCAQRGCLADTDCAEPTPICNPATNECSSGAAGGCDVPACESQCAAQVDPLTQQPMTCNQATCACNGQGGSGAGCVTSADCPQGEACGLGICTPMAVNPDGSECDAMTCTLGGMLGAPCVSATDPNHQCDGTMCLMSMLFGGGGAAPCL